MLLTSSYKITTGENKMIYKQSSNRENMTWKGAIGLKQKYGGWNSLARAEPYLVKDIYHQFKIADLGKAFVQEYAGSNRGDLQKHSYNISRDLAKLGGIEREIDFMGSCRAETRGTDETNWREANVWDDGIKFLEDVA
jgi:hypothetical protein